MKPSTVLLAGFILWLLIFLPPMLVCAEDKSVQRECAEIRKEIAICESYIAMNKSNFAIQASARKKIARLESRAAELHCGAAFSSSAPNNASSIEECIEACIKYTNRSSEQCFDVCNK